VDGRPNANAVINGKVRSIGSATSLDQSQKIKDAPAGRLSIKFADYRQFKHGVSGIVTPTPNTSKGKSDCVRRFMAATTQGGREARREGAPRPARVDHSTATERRAKDVTWTKEVSS